jgi:hypothetical protein
LRKNLFLSCLALFVLGTSLVVSVEADSIFWAYSYETKFDSRIETCVVATSDGGYAVAGSLNSHASLFKTDAYGNMEWNKTYQGIWSDHFYSLVVASDGGYAIAGSTNGDFWLVKTDEYGNMEWNKTYGGTHPDRVSSLVATSDGGYAMAGTLTSEDVVQFDAWLVKTDAYGNMEWNKTFGKFGVADLEFFYSVVETSDGGFALAGTQYTHGLVDGKWIEKSDENFWLIKTDSFGNVLWEKTYGGEKDDIVCSVVEASDGGYALAGTTYSFWGTGTYYNFWLVKTDQYGNVEWDKLYGVTDSTNTAHSMIRTSDGGYAIAGSTYCSDDIEGLDFWLVKTDASGNMEWNTSIGSGVTDVPQSLAEANDGGYVMVGTISDRHWVVSYILLVKTDETGYAAGDFVPEYHSLLLPSMLLAAASVIVLCKKRLLPVHERIEQ